GLNDNRIVETHLYKHVDRENPRIEVLLMPAALSESPESYRRSPAAPRIASMRLSREALWAGYRPKKSPTASENTNATTITSIEMTVGQPATTVVSFAPITPSTIPNTPPNRLKVMASMRNCIPTCPPLAPTAMRTPISLVRS